MRSKHIEKILINTVIFISICIFFWQYTGIYIYPGDSGDTRFSTYLLEYFYQALISPKLKFTSLNYLYPLEDNIFFSETMWGSAWIYAVFRFLNFSIEHSYNFYFISTFLINFFCAFIVIKKFELSYFSSVFGAYLFTFGLPIIAQDAHPQLFLRAAVPLGFYFFYSFMNEIRSYQIFLSIFFLFIQSLTSIYTGFFLGVLYLVIFLTYDLDFKKYRFGEKNLKNYIKKLSKYLIFLKDNKFFNLLSLISITIFFYYLYKYYIISSMYGYGRSYPLTYLINLFSFFTTNRSILFPEILPSIYPLHEQQLYLGLSSLVIIFFLIKNKIYKLSLVFQERLMKIILFNILIFFGIAGISIYLFIYFLPGVSAIRAPCRSILVIIFPISLYFGFIIDLLKNYFSIFGYNLFKVLLLLLLIFEISTAKKTTSNIEDEQKKIDEVSIQLNNLKNKKIIVFKNKGDLFDDYYTDISVSLATLDRGLYTLNGYTSFVPVFYRPFVSCDDIKIYINDFNEFISKNELEQYPLNFKDIKFIGFSNNCDYL